MVGNQKKKVVIVGGGLVGALNAVFFGQSNQFEVLLCEKRSDIRSSSQSIGRTINLVLSHRGYCALKILGIEDKILESGVPLYGRMIHQKNGNLQQIPYGKSNECIYALDRKALNELLLTEVENTPNVQARFQMKLIDVNFNNKIAKFSTSSGKVEEIEFDLLVGNDGAFSAVRHFMLKSMNMDFSQEYIPHGYKEVFFPAGSDGRYLMDKNSLHIWPRNEYMLIGLPNPDGSFTGTMFMPFEIFDSIQTKEKLHQFFQSNFPDALEIMGKSNVENFYFSNKASPMVTIRCHPYNYSDICVIMGDAAHAMVPFYGQGMNCGFEDLIIFHEILKENNFNLENIGSAFTKKRNEDAKAICELAFFNYAEMRKHVNSRWFLLRKGFDNLMNRLFPSYWIPLYTMVTFTRMPYAKCISERRKQDKILSILGKVTLGLVIVVPIVVGGRFCGLGGMKNFFHYLNMKFKI